PARIRRQLLDASNSRRDVFLRGLFCSAMDLWGISPVRSRRQLVFRRRRTPLAVLSENRRGIASGFLETSRPGRNEFAQRRDRRRLGSVRRAARLVDRRLDERSAAMKRFLVVISLVLAIAPATRAHVGSPNVFFDGQAGPNPVRVILRPPAVLP